MAFFGKYVEVSSNSRLSTLTLEDRGDTTQIVLLEVYLSGAAYEAAKGSCFAQLDELLAGSCERAG